jgi:tetratricopeptide (TPR) repeat protein
MTFRLGVAIAALLVLPEMAAAGDQPLYAPAPSWIKPAAITSKPDQAVTGGPVLLDIQQRIEGPTVWTYSDTAFRLDTPEALSQSSNITVAWSPDKGNLVIHKLSIVRGGVEIDALGAGQKFTVLRREQQLEQRELSGVLSATMAVEGLRVGDIMRLQMSISSSDAALGGKAQSAQFLVADPVRIPAAAYNLSWRAGEPVKWKMFADKVNAAPTRKGDFIELPVALPIPKQGEIPDDAPARFYRPQVIEASTFNDWAEVSKVMAPLYEKASLLPEGSEIAAEVANIRRSTNDPLRRAALALQLVQDKIRYLAIGMDGGNYIPQSPARTWELRYGDCKAKTLLLLTMLKALDITAEPVLAHSVLGDLVPLRVPSVLAFNHVLVRATVGQDTLWLDGTKLGTRLADIRDTPALGHVLPVRANGAELLTIVLRAPARPSVDLSLEMDESTSVDIPSVITLDMVVRGELASTLTLAASQLPEKDNRELIDTMIQRYVGAAQYETLTSTPDVENGSIRIRGRGVFTTGWKFEERRMERWLSRVPNLIAFKPDRARPAWADIPVLTGTPDVSRYKMRIRLPDAGRGYTIEGEQNLDTVIAGTAVKRSVSMSDGIVVVEETFSNTGAEIAPAQLTAEVDKVTTIKARSPRLIASPEARRRWNLDGAASSSQLQSVKAIFAKAIADADEENVSSLTSGWSFYRGIGDYKSAVETLTKQIAILPSAEAYLTRASSHYELGNIKDALRDAEEARKLDSASPQAVITIANYTAIQGDIPKAIAMLDERIALGGKTRSEYRMAKAGLVGEFGDELSAISELDALNIEKAGSPALLNARCWVKATQNIQLESALKDCTSAIELSESTPTILDSRALVWMRMGRDEDALRDLDAALNESPGTGPTRFLRAIVNKRLGNSAQAAIDLSIARKLTPSIERDYARFGLKP